jgi:deoxyribonuclease-4
MKEKLIPLGCYSMKFGVHVSISGGISKSVSRAKKIGCNTFQIFTRNPRSWVHKELVTEEVTNFKDAIQQSNIKPVFSHMPYLPNLASPEEVIWEKSISTLSLELKRCDALDIPFIVSHIGSPKNEKKEKGIANVITALDNTLSEYDGNCMILLENTAGKDGRLGSNMADICNIISEIELSNKVGLCFDTCHAYASGYNLQQKEVIELLLSDIDECIGLSKLLLIHCNDTQVELGSGIDRHEHIGLGNIGDIGFKNILLEKQLRKVPFICETPVDERRSDDDNLKYLKSLYSG